MWCSESDGVWWWYRLCQQAGKNRGENDGERVVPTKSRNVRPEWNSCCTLCPDCLTTCDSGESNRINDHSHTAPPSEKNWKIERLPLAPLPAADSEYSWNFPYFSPALYHKMWKFPTAWFWAVGRASNGKPEEKWGGVQEVCVWCRAVWREEASMCEFNKNLPTTAEGPALWQISGQMGREFYSNLNYEGLNYKDNYLIVTCIWLRAGAHSSPCSHPRSNDTTDKPALLHRHKEV